MLRIFFLLAFCLVSSLTFGQSSVDFNFDIKPILSDRCYVCHGPDEENREAELRLDEKEGAFRESESGNVDKVVQPGDHEQSELWLRIVSNDEDVVMPPPDSHLALTADEKTLIKDWINQGADWKEHWSFISIPKSKPSTTVGTPSDRIDEFVQRKLVERRLEPSQLASKETLIRRVSFDITGLPPSVEDVEAFLADETADAYERVVDRLLASPHFGERMASDWLDVARYSDTYGYQVDRDRFVWPYRDWVVRQFNENLPYDEFITAQLAGDLLPNPTRDDYLATTFNRLHPQKVEGGSVPEEFRIEYVADRAQTVATSMLGLTFECARCHDHKYDPISQKEYYQLTAFFDKIDEAGLYSYFTPSVPTPTLLLGEAEFDEKRAKLRKLRVAAEGKVAAKRGAFLAGPRKAEDAGQAVAPKPIEHLSFDDWKPNGGNKSVEGISGKAVRLSGDDAVKLKKGNFARYQPFSISFWLNVGKEWERAVVFHRSRAWTDAGSRGYECLIEDGRLSTALIHFWPGNAIGIRMKDKLPLNEWHQITITYDGSSRASGLMMYLDGQATPTETVRDNLYKEIRGGGNDQITIGERFRDTGLKGGLVDEFQVFDRELWPFEVRLLQGLPAFDEATTEERGHVELSRNESYLAAVKELEQARKQECELVKGVQEIMVMREAAQQRQTYILTRGEYDARAEPVSASTPSWLPELGSKASRATRLDFANWLTRSDHPLTSRVAVNRLWQIVFGHGIVRTPEDFGSQGQLPTHPELLDWLARDYIDSGWDTKRLTKNLVMTKTYRQSSVASAELLETDPENKLLARAPSYRWPAEMLRDQALAVGNLLVDRQGGPPAKPYDLKDSFKPMNPDKGDGVYRRSLYTFWKRTGPSPAMMALDAAKRDVCRVKRSRTSSPLQTLVLMNGPQFVEASRALAQTVLEEQGGPNDRVRSIFVRLTGRSPDKQEQAVLENLYARQRKVFSGDPEQLKKYLAVGNQEPAADLDKVELATLTSIANALLGFDEVMMKR